MSILLATPLPKPISLLPDDGVTTVQHLTSNEMTFTWNPLSFIYLKSAYTDEVPDIKGLVDGTNWLLPQKKNKNQSSLPQHAHLY